MSNAGFLFLCFFMFFIFMFALEVKDIKRQRDKSNEEHDEAREELLRFRIGYSIEDENQLHQRKHQAAERRNWQVQNTVATFSLFLSIVTAGGAVAGALYAKNAFVQARRQADSADIANRMNAESGRAWIAPGFIQFIAAPSLDQGFSVQVKYANVGREPAISFSARSSMIITPTVSFVSNWAEFDNPTVNLCLPIDNYTGSDVAYPASIPNSSAWMVSSKTIPPVYIYRKGTKTFFVGDPFDDVVSRKYVITVNGCAVYITANTKHFSRYCYLLQPDPSKPIQEWIWIHCRNGNEAS